MGLVGWAEAADSVGCQKQQNDEGSYVTETIEVNAAEVSPVLDADKPEGAELMVDDKNSTMPSSEVAFTDSESAPAEEQSCFAPECDNVMTEAAEVLDAIRNVRLTSRLTDENVLDISRFELHEIEFLYNHAERVSFIDPFAVVKGLFEIKHRILEQAEDVETISSPNLDALLEFAESKYAKAFEDKDA